MGDLRPFALGDMIVAEPPPPRLAQALAVIAEYLHPALDMSPMAIPGKSRISCILCSLVVRDFLFRGGFRDAQLRPVVFVIRAEDEDGRELHSLGVGNPQGPDPRKGNAWDGHAVVTAGGWLIDTTLYQANRPQWPALPGMLAVPLMDDLGLKVMGLPMLSGFVGAGPSESRIDLAWGDQPTNKLWRDAPDAQRPVARRRVVDFLLEHFNLKGAQDNGTEDARTIVGR